MAQTVIITGGSGFVGRHLQAELAAAWLGANVISWDLPEVDITKPQTYAKELAHLKPSWLVHLAAIASVPQAIKDPELTFRVNVEAAQQLFEAAVKVHPNVKIFAVSSADIYGPSESPIAEAPLSLAKPKNAYGESKLNMEEMVERRFIEKTIRVRPFPHIGPGQQTGFVTADFASQIAAIEAGRQDPILQVGNLEARRDFTDVRDVVRAYRLLMEKGGLGQVYNVSSGRAVSIQSVLDRLLALSHAHITVQQDPEKMRPSDVPAITGDSTKLRRATGWEPRMPLEQSLQDILDYWRREYSR